MRYDRFEADKVIYVQDGEFYRYQDRLRWSRFQTIIVIEGAWLATVFGGLSLPSLGAVGHLAVLLFGSLLVAFLCLLSLKDEVDANRHMDRLITFERKLWQRPLLSFSRAPTHDTLGDMILYPLRRVLPSGSTLTIATVGLITVFNLGVVWRRAGPAWAIMFVLAAVIGSVVSWWLSKRKPPGGEGCADAPSAGQRA